MEALTALPVNPWTITRDSGPTAIFRSVSAYDLAGREVLKARWQPALWLKRKPETTMLPDRLNDCPLMMKDLCACVRDGTDGTDGTDEARLIAERSCWGARSPWLSFPFLNQRRDSPFAFPFAFHSARPPLFACRTFVKALLVTTILWRGYASGAPQARPQLIAASRRPPAQ